jgi:hypothetical protein
MAPAQWTTLAQFLAPQTAFQERTDETLSRRIRVTAAASRRIHCFTRPFAVT